MFPQLFLKRIPSKSMKTGFQLKVVTFMAKYSSLTFFLEKEKTFQKKLSYEVNCFTQ